MAGRRAAAGNLGETSRTVHYLQRASRAQESFGADVDLQRGMLLDFAAA
jgi:hypothetical protein